MQLAISENSTGRTCQNLKMQQEALDKIDLKTQRIHPIKSDNSKRRTWQYLKIQKDALAKTWKCKRRHWTKSIRKFKGCTWKITAFKIIHLTKTENRILFTRSTNKVPANQKTMSWTKSQNLHLFSPYQNFFVWRNLYYIWSGTLDEFNRNPVIRNLKIDGSWYAQRHRRNAPDLL